jgi:hypothetical protein
MFRPRIDPYILLLVVPLMMFHQMQLMVCAWLARRYGERGGPTTPQQNSPANSRARTPLAISAPGPAGDAGT